ncbi:MAG: DUF4326 domain-containing protein [Alphaproteobacteria bacterium]|nr:DUF4326 domain-containing protein [Alphaproteobacteria bacterium]
MPDCKTCRHIDLSHPAWPDCDHPSGEPCEAYERWEQQPPKRIQRKRTKGWKMPDGAVYVGRGSKWGSPFKVGEPFARPKMQPGGGETSGFVFDRAHAVQLYRRFLPLEVRIAARIELRGKDLACWCPPDQPCHADILLRIANA